MLSANVSALDIDLFCLKSYLVSEFIGQRTRFETG